MRDLIVKFMSADTKESIKRLMMLFFSLILGFVCIWATIKGDWLYVIASLIGFILTLAGMSTYENNKKLKIKQQS